MITKLASGSGTASVSGDPRAWVRPDLPRSAPEVYNDGGIGGHYVDGAYIGSATVEGTPPLAEPDLYSTSVDITGEQGENNTYRVYMSELNQFPLGGQFQGSSTGGSAYTLGGTLPPGFNSIQSFTVSTYVTECIPANSACSASDAFATGTLLYSDTYTQGGVTSQQDFAANPETTAPYVVTEVYTFSTGSGYGEIQGSEMEQIPEPASMALLGMGLVGLGMFRRRTTSRATAG